MQWVEHKRFAQTLCRYFRSKEAESKNTGATTTAATTKYRPANDYESSTVELHVI
jgi:hypothetical protein